MMQAFYKDNGQIDSINDTETGETIAVFLPNGTIYSTYDTPTAREIAAQFPAFDSSKVIVPPTLPDWNQFQRSIVGSAAYIRIVSESPQAQVINSNLVWAMGQLQQDPGIMPNVAALWNAIVKLNAPTVEEVAELNQIAEVCNLPIRLNQQGQINV